MIWVLIPLAAIFGWIIIEYQENKLKMMQKSNQNREDVEELQNQIEKLQKRIENLEAIAAETPDEFSATGYSGKSRAGFEPEDHRAENEMKISEMARKQKLKS